MRRYTPIHERKVIKEGSAAELRADRLALDETFGMIEYHARIIANWRMKVSMGPDDMLLDQAERIVELIKSLPEDARESTAGGHDQ